MWRSCNGIVSCPMGDEVVRSVKRHLILSKKIVQRSRGTVLLFPSPVFWQRNQVRHSLPIKVYIKTCLMLLKERVSAQHPLLQKLFWYLSIEPCQKRFIYMKENSRRPRESWCLLFDLAISNKLWSVRYCTGDNLIIRPTTICLILCPTRLNWSFSKQWR